jgi:uncharacterized membrane protein
VDLAGRTLLFLHVLGAISALGPTLTYGLWVAWAEKADPGSRAFVLRSISRIDGRLATPSYVLQALTGVGLIVVYDFSVFHTPWLLTGVSLYVVITVVAITRYAPAFREQSALADRIAAAPDDADARERYERVAARSRIYGLVAVVLTILVVLLMVTKPALWE